MRKGDMKQKLSKSSFEYYVLPNKIICSMVGVWLIERESSMRTQVFAAFRLLLLVSATGSLFLPEILLISANWGDLQILTGVGIVSTTLAQLLFKLPYLIARRKRVHDLYNELRDLWSSTDDLTERRSYEVFGYWARTITIICFIFTMYSVLIFATSSGIEYIQVRYNISNKAGEELHLPFDVWYGTDISEFPRFEIAFLSQIIAGSICGAAVCGLDTTIMTVILHLCGQFKLINTWIRNIGTETRAIANPKALQKVEANLIRCIRHHQRMINVVNEVNNLFTPIIFMQLLTSGIEFCLSGFTVFNNASTVDLIKFISFLITLTMQLSVWCFPGEILIHESQQIGEAVYTNVPWYNLPSKYQKQLCLIIVRSQHYCSITAITFQMLSLHSLTTVFNTAASYFALLRQMQSK